MEAAAGIHWLLPKSPDIADGLGSVGLVGDGTENPRVGGSIPPLATINLRSFSGIERFPEFSRVNS